MLNRQSAERQREGKRENKKQIKRPSGVNGFFQRKTYGPFFRDFEIANDEIGQLLLVIVTNSDAVVDLLFPLGCRPILNTHDLDR